MPWFARLAGFIHEARAWSLCSMALCQYGWYCNANVNIQAQEACL